MPKTYVDNYAMIFVYNKIIKMVLITINFLIKSQLNSDNIHLDHVLFF